MPANYLYRADCKEAIPALMAKGIKVDLIYLDPPFNSNRTYHLIYQNKGIAAQHKAFSDLWTLTSQNQQLLLQFGQTLEGMQGISTLVKGFLRGWIASLETGESEDQKMLVYLVYMTERLILMKQVLKETGGIYLHCDPTASHYLKIIMDGIFGRENFRNEIVWKRREEKHNLAKRHMGKSHDVLLYYAKTSAHQYALMFTEYDARYVKTHYKHQDAKGYYATFPATNEAGGNKPYDFMGITRAWRFAAEKMQKMYDDGLLIQHKPGSPFRYKKYLATAQGVPLQDIWDDIAPVRGKDTLGYPTQKPVALLNRILQASCPKNGLVLDPFCGCGTTLASAIENAMAWIGMDISYDATDVIKERLKQQVGVDKGLYTFVDGSPETRQEYERLDAYAKQDWLIRKVGGFPNPKKSWDGGVDGELMIHLGEDAKGKDQWAKMLFSVKTGKQSSSNTLGELIGTLKSRGAAIGGLIMDADPSSCMQLEADRQGSLGYVFKPNLPKNHYQKIQILTSQEIIDGHRFSTPPTFNDLRLHRGDKQLSL